MKPFDESESPGEVSRHRAAHWAEFYERLTAFEMEILDKMLSLAQHLPPDQVAAVELTNINPRAASAVPRFIRSAIPAERS
jgi:predicted LPLAT superfamily acyltransferase